MDNMWYFMKFMKFSYMAVEGDSGVQIIKCIRITTQFNCKITMAIHLDLKSIEISIETSGLKL